MAGKDRLNLYFDAATSRALDELAARKKLSKSAIVDAAVASFLGPDGADRKEAALSRRLDRMTRAIERLERGQTIMLEALGLFVRAWLTATPPLADSAQPTAQAKGRERYESFVETLGRRVQQEQQGRDRLAAVVEACRLRLRPILMTSLAFILGVVPLLIAEGAGAEMRRAVGAAVFFGMLGVTAFGLIFTPVFYVVVRQAAAWRPARWRRVQPEAA